MDTGPSWAVSFLYNAEKREEFEGGGKVNLELHDWSCSGNGTRGTIARTVRAHFLVLGNVRKVSAECGRSETGRRWQVQRCGRKIRGGHTDMTASRQREGVDGFCSCVVGKN